MKKNILNVVAVILIIVLTSCTINVNQSSGDSPETIPGSGPIETGSGSLTVKLIYAEFFYDTVSAQNDTPTTQIKVLDLATGDGQVIFNVTGNAWIYSLAVSPDGRELLISCTPPLNKRTSRILLFLQRLWSSPNRCRYCSIRQRYQIVIPRLNGRCMGTTFIMSVPTIGSARN